MYNTWEELKEELKKCNKCRLCNVKTNIVIGDGNKKANIMIIGDAPDNESDKTGIPFAGGYGQLMKKAIQGVGLEESNIYYTNILKCKPDLANGIQADEIQNCMNYLRNEFFLIKPKIIILLGNMAVKCLLGNNMDINKIHGNWIEKKEIYFLPTWHPMDIIRNENRKIEFWNDMKKVKEKEADINNE